ncbi:fas-binding factor 1 [Nilaparvata lugens]|uniref:fas-binding factor 1 n=1 Tax=Nilaparvata lugens TaxID=108931 RepID=UPI00193D942D|nr:fas-binding factor 1 [Nilaparvata lugens]
MEKVPDDNYDMTTSILKDTDDMNDELFGALKRGNRGSKKTSAFSTEDGGKKKVGYGEFDDSDPLGDISLSDDDDFYGVGDIRQSNKINPNSSILTASVNERPEKSTKSVINNLDKPSKSKLIADLFGLDETETTTEQPAADKRKSDWLGIKESPKKSVTINEGADKSKSQTFSSSTTDSKIRKKSLEFEVPTETDKPKVSLEKEGSSVTKIFSRDDDISNLLAENKEVSHDKVLARRSSLKKKEITDELFGKASSSRITDVKSSTTVVAGSDAKQDFLENTAEKKGEGSVGASQYLPSSGSGRRTGFGRRREGLSSVQPGSSTEILPARKDDAEKNWLFGVNDDSEKKSVQSAPLPSWLGGENKAHNEPLPKSPEKKPQEKDMNQEKEKKPEIEVPKAKSAPIIKEMKQDDELATTKSNEEGSQLKDLLSSSSVVDKNNAAILQQTESGLLAVVQMKQQKDLMTELVNRQANILRVQEQQMNQLMEQQARRQQLVEVNMKKQQERINVLLQALLTESGKDAVPNVQHDEGISFSLSLPVLNSQNRNESSDEDDNPAENGIQEDTNEKPNTNMRSRRKLKNTVSKLEIEIHKLEMEKATFEQRLEIQESRHNDEIKIMEKFHRHEISSWEEREEQLKQRLADLKADYDERITQLHDQQEKLIQQHNIRIENLQQEKMEDLKQLGEFHRLAMDQVASISKLLLDDSRLIEKKKAFEEKKPLDTTELSAREAALINKENEITAIKDSLEKQRLNLIAEKDKMEEKLEQEKRALEESNRQLRKQQSALKYREEEFQREQEREKDFIKSLRKQLEELKENALREQKIAMEERLQITANQARLDTLAKLQGQEPSAISCIDIIQAKGEMEGALAAAKEVRCKVEEDKQKLHQQQINLEAEKWRLQELETELTNKQQHIEHLIKLSETQRKEGVMALEEAKQKERRAEERLQEAEQRLQEVALREKKIMKVK